MWWELQVGGGVLVEPAGLGLPQAGLELDAGGEPSPTFPGSANIFPD